MTDNDCRILAKACELKWHEIVKDNGILFCNCGAWFRPYNNEEVNTHIKRNRTFADTDDYEALREKVIEENLDEFCSWLNKFIPSYFPSLFHWWLAMSPEQCNELICDFGIECLGWEVEK